MQSTTRALHLIDLLYRASVGDAPWDDFVSELSEAYDGALVSLRLPAPERPRSQTFYSAGLPEDFGEFLSRSMHRRKYGSSLRTLVSEGFQPLSRLLPVASIDEWDFYRSWMAPHGLPAAWPITLGIATGPVTPNGGVVILRQPGAENPGEFARADLEFADSLIPHLRRAVGLHTEMAGEEWNRRAMQEVVERLRLGVIFLDPEGRPVMSNPSADRILTLRERLGVRDGRLYATRPRDDRMLQDAIVRALGNLASRRFHLAERFFFVGGEEDRVLDFCVKPLPSGTAGSGGDDSALVVLVANAEGISDYPVDNVRHLYSLTGVEADLLRLLVGGATIAEAAERRGVTLNTARSQLKALFEKTNTKSQAALIQLVLAGISRIWAEYDASDRTVREVAHSKESGP